jgi:hypothetical protein
MSMVMVSKDTKSVPSGRFFTISKKLPTFLKERTSIPSWKRRRQGQALLRTSFRRRLKAQDKDSRLFREGRQSSFLLGTKGTTRYARMPFRNQTGFRRRRMNRWQIRRLDDKRIGISPRRFFHTHSSRFQKKQTEGSLSNLGCKETELRGIRIQKGNQRMDWQTRRGMNHGNLFIHQKAVRTRRKQMDLFSTSQKRKKQTSGILGDYFLRYVLGVELANVRQGRKSVSVVLPSFPRRRMKRRIRRRGSERGSISSTSKEKLFSIYQERILGKGRRRKQRKRTLEALELRKRVRKKRWWPKESQLVSPLFFREKKKRIL